MDAAELAGERGWKELLLDQLMEMPPDAFERLAQRLLPPAMAPPIGLIDGDRLCELLKRYDLGVRTATRIVEDVSIDAAFFGEI